MINILKFQQANKYLEKYAAIGTFRKSEDKLEVMRRLMNFLGNPQEKYRVIHVAGTSGKSSTCYYISSLLSLASKKVGMTLSPHVYEINERLQINGTPLNEAQFCSKLTVFAGLVESSGIIPTYFEFMTAFAYWEFAEQRIDFAVVEVGIGGLLDSTNVVNRQDKISVITDIGLDHTKLLGDNLEKITYQKAGIINQSSLVFMHQQINEVMSAVEAVCSMTQSSLRITPITSKEELVAVTTDLPEYQKRNWLLAHELYKYLSQNNGIKALDEESLLNSVSIHIPGRMEKIEINNKLVILDGAHNPQKLELFKKSLTDENMGRFICIFGSLITRNENLSEMLRIISPVVSEIIFCNFASVTAGKEFVEAKYVADEWAKVSKKKFQIIPDPQDAILFAADSYRPVVVAGSLFLPNIIRPLLYKYENSNKSDSRN